MLMKGIVLASLLGVVMPVQTDWRPINRPLPPVAALQPAAHASIAYQSHIPEPSEDGCTLYKALFDQETPSQYVQYKAPIPDLKEFTLCNWHKFYNHSRDQPLFTYSSSPDRPKDIYAWVSNSDRASYYMLTVMGQTMYRLNYPVRLHKWYHLCQSWNGRTGEWQIWINSERIGRGFHNLLVGRVIKGGGVALSGQEPARNSLTAYQDLYKPSGGLLGEVTLIQLYKAALTAGKAYTNHKHHHAHHFHHDDKLGEDDYRIAGVDPLAMQLQEAMQPSLGNEYPFLRHGQLIPSLPIHELSAFRGQQQSALNPQLNVLGSSLLGGQDSSYGLQHMRLYKREHTKEPETMTMKPLIPKTPAPKTVLVIRTRETIKNKRQKIMPLDTDEEIDEIDGKMAFKRDTEEVIKEDRDETKSTNSQAPSITNIERDKRSVEIEKELKPEATESDESRSKSKRDADQPEKTQKKRTALLGDMPFGVIPGTDLSGLFAGEGYILGGGGLKLNDESNQSLDKDTDQVQMEPAEWEVRSIMAVCTGCSEDPFRKATIISWRETPKKLYSGVLYIPAIPECQRF